MFRKIQKKRVWEETPRTTIKLLVDFLLVPFIPYGRFYKPMQPL